MAATNFTPISLYYSTTASAVPTSGNLVAGELALNTLDEKLYFKNSAGTVKLLASNAASTGTVSSVAVSGGTTGLTTSGGPITTSGTITLAGTLATTNGGTNLTSFTSGGAVYATSTSALTTGTLPIASGGTGQTTANAAFNALVPSQTSQSGKYLTTDGTNTSWGTNPLGTVTSVAATVPSFLSIAGSPITTSGTLAISLSGTALPTTSGGTGLTSFTSGGVVYASSSSALATGSTLTFDGTTLIAAGASGRIQVAPSTTTNNALFQATNGGGSAYFGLDNSAGSSLTSQYALNIYHNGNYPIVFSTNATARMRILGGGNVGIGLDAPTQRLEVVTNTSTNDAYNPAAAFGTAAGANQGGVIGSRTIAADTTQGLYISSGQTLTLNSSAGIRFQIGALPATASSTATEYMRLTTTGLGIGTTSPSNQLHVAGASTTQVRVQMSGQADMRIISDTGYGALSNDSNMPLLFRTNATERARIDSSGNFLVGITSPTFSASTRKSIEVNGSTDSFITWGAGGSAVGYLYASSSEARLYSFANVPLLLGTNNTERARIDSSGNLLVATTLQKGPKLNVMGGNIVPATSGSTQTGGLRVSSLATGSGGYVLDMGVSDSNAYAWMQVSNSADLSSGFVKPLVLQPVAGNVGIGTTAPVAKLDIAGDYKEGVVTANTSTAYTISLATGTIQFLTLTGNCTYTFPTPVAGKSFTLVQKQDATGGRTVTWPASVKWPGGTAPTLTSTASKADKFIFTAIDGSSWLGSNGGQNYTV